MLARTSRGNVARMQLSSRARRRAPALVALAALAVTPIFDRQATGSQAAGSSGPHHRNLESGSGHPTIRPVAANVKLPKEPDHPALAGPPESGQPNAQPDQKTISQLARSGIPAVALLAYRDAANGLAQTDPSCHLSWPLLAAIGRVESDQGQFGGAALQTDGNESKPVIGVQLDGAHRGIARIPDTDHGRYDGDPKYDRAVGPMQFLPTTWARYGADGNGDGIADPHQIDDAARAAAAYLCAEGRDIASGEGWWDGVLTYNRSVNYARLVWAAADRYAAATTTP